MTAEAIALDGYEEVVDSESGEIFLLPTGPDRLAVLAGEYKAADAQVKAWSQTKAFLAGLIVKYQPDRKVVAGDYTSTLVFASREVQDIPQIRGVLESVELTLEEWRELALAATGYEVARLQPRPQTFRVQAVGASAPEQIETRDIGPRGLVLACTTRKDNAPYPRIAAVKRMKGGSL